VAAHHTSFKIQALPGRRGGPSHTGTPQGPLGQRRQRPRRSTVVYSGNRWGRRRRRGGGSFHSRVGPPGPEHGASWQATVGGDGWRVMDGGVDGSRHLRTYRHLIQHPRHTFSQLRAKQARADLNARPAGHAPSPTEDPSREEVPRKGSRHRPDSHMPAAAQQPQQHEDCNSAGEPDDHLGMAEHGHLSLQDVVGGLALRQGGLTRAQLVEALVEGGGRPGGRGGDVPHHDVDRIWKISKSVNKIRIRIQFIVPGENTSNKYSSVPKLSDRLDKSYGNL